MTKYRFMLEAQAMRTWGAEEDALRDGFTFTCIHPFGLPVTGRHTAECARKLDDELNKRKQEFGSSYDAWVAHGRPFTTRLIDTGEPK